MAIIKNITLQNGVNTSYHRIVSVNNIVNTASIIEVASYTEKAKREEEKAKLTNKEPMDIFINTKYFSIPYNKNLGVESAYQYIKSLDNFQNSTDDL